MAEEKKKKALELKKMGVIELEFHDKHKKNRIEYHPIVKIKKWIKSYLKKNPKWVAEKEDYCGLKTGRWILWFDHGWPKI